MTDADKDKRIKELEARCEKLEDNSWYSDGFMVLNPLRWHLNEMVEMCEQYNIFAKHADLPPLRKDKIAAARRANDAVNEHFTHGRK